MVFLQKRIHFLQVTVYLPFPGGHNLFAKGETFSLPFYLGNPCDFLQICFSTTLDHEPSKQVSCLRKRWKTLAFNKSILHVCLLNHKFGVVLWTYMSSL